MEHESPIMKAWREVALADPEDCDREWEAYLALVSGKETASVSPSTDTTSTLHSRVHGPAVVSASSATRSTASLHAPSSAISTTTPAAAASTSTSTRESSPATKDDLSPESRLIYDYIVGNSDEFASRDGLSPGARRYYDYLISGSAPPASATTDASTNLDNTDLTAPTPTICSSECPSKDAPTSVPVITPSTTPDSSTTICAVVPELSAPADSAKALDMDVMGDTAPTATICLPGGPDHNTGGEDPMDMSLTPWSAPPSYNATPEDWTNPLSAPMDILELFKLSPSTCSTDCSGSSIMMFSTCLTTHTIPSCLLSLASTTAVTAVQRHDLISTLSKELKVAPEPIEMPPSMLTEASQVFNDVPAATAFVPWPPPSWNHAIKPLIREQDSCHDAQQKHGNELLVSLDSKENWNAIWLDVELKPPWPFPGLCMNLPTATANSAMEQYIHYERPPDRDKSDCAASRYCADVLICFRLEEEKGQMLLSMPWQSVRFHWVATYPILLWKLLTSHPHEDPSGFAKSFVLYWTSPLDENKMHLLHVAETLWSKLLSMGNMEDCLQYEHQHWRPPDPVISLACMGELFLRFKDCRSDIWVHILDAISARLSTSTIMPAGKLCLLLGQLCLLGFLVVQPFSTKAQAVTLCPNEVSLGNFAISSVDYMMMNRYTPCYAWMMLNDSFLPAGISSYFKFAAGNTIIFLPWDPGLPLSSIDAMFSTVVDGLAARLRRSSEVICLQRNSIYELFSCKKGMVALEEQQPWTSWECVIFLQPKPPWSYVGPTISFGVAESLHIIWVCLEFTQFVLAPSQGSGTYGCLNFERNLMGQNFICPLGLYSSYDQYIAQDATYFGFQPTATCALLKIQPVGGYCKFYAAFLFSRDSTSTRALAIKYISRMICLPRQHSEMGNNLAVAMLLLSSQISKGWVLYLPVTCIMQCRSELLPWVLAYSRDGILTYIKRVLISWDPGGSVLVLHAATGDNWNSSQQPFLHLTWDPGGYMQHRLEGKPNLKEGGLSTTHSIRGLGRTMDFHLVGLGLLRSHGRSATKEKQRTTIKGAWNGTERRLRPRLG